ncbi:hypothetical protein BJ165DRAFT_1532666 [Panaeolus papilionaceus]|nr:hypothetical protein BJ165DRAFT_1532666 [Panaeolus papilionaceus]
MVNPSAFRGRQHVYLMGRKPKYTIARATGTVVDVLANIIQDYFDIFNPLENGRHWAPTKEEFEAAVLADPRPEPVAPNQESMTEEEYKKAAVEWENRKALIRYIKAQIKRWFAYQYMKDHNMTNRRSKSSSNPLFNILFQLSDKSVKRPCLLSAKSIWQHSHQVTINTEARQQCLREKKSAKTGLAPIRESIATTMFNALSEEERVAFVERASAEHAAALEQWEKYRENPIKTDPASLQRCINNLTAVAQPLLDTMTEATKWKGMLVLGGPSPAEGGRLNMIWSSSSLHLGTTSGAEPMTFGWFEHTRFRSQFVPMFTNFLRNCWSPEECREYALDPALEDYNELSMTVNNKDDKDETMISLDEPLSSEDDPLPPSPSPPAPPRSSPSVPGSPRVSIQRHSSLPAEDPSPPSPARSPPGSPIPSPRHPRPASLPPTPPPRSPMQSPSPPSIRSPM